MSTDAENATEQPAAPVLTTTDKCAWCDNIITNAEASPAIPVGDGRMACSESHASLVRSRDRLSRAPLTEVDVAEHEPIPQDVTKEPLRLLQSERVELEYTEDGEARFIVGEGHARRLLANVYQFALTHRAGDVEVPRLALWFWRGGPTTTVVPRAELVDVDALLARNERLSIELSVANAQRLRVAGEAVRLSNLYAQDQHTLGFGIKPLTHQQIEQFVRNAELVEVATRPDYETVGDVAAASWRLVEDLRELSQSQLDAEQGEDFPTAPLYEEIAVCIRELTRRLMLSQATIDNVVRAQSAQATRRADWRAEGARLLDDVVEAVGFTQAHVASTCEQGHDMAPPEQLTRAIAVLRTYLANDARS